MTNHIPIGKDPIAHDRRCTRRGPFVETIATSSTGHATVTVVCLECNHNDEKTATSPSGPDAAA